ncbi:MAG: hypothetical protein NUV91_00755 [Candidatus Omnitrophica bacterium]|nr:hypothetical protein [Candidatus Omnitrophota bacterium]
MLGLIWVVSIFATVFLADQKRMSIVGYFFLSLILGPLALIVVLLSPARNFLSDDPQIKNLQQAQEQIFQLKQTLSVLNQKIADLEQNVGKFTSVEAESSLPLALSSSHEKNSTSTLHEGWELIFGKYWLNRVGVVFFVIGVGFFISYSFQYFSAWAKIGLGYIFAISFLLLGKYLEKKDKYRKLSW